jgi:hypothetical protein
LASGLAFELLHADQTTRRMLIDVRGLDPGCILHLRGAAHASGRRLRVRHFAEILAARLEARLARG